MSTWSHSEFPESAAVAPDMVELVGETSARNIHVHLGVRYALKDAIGLHLVVAQPSLD